MNNAVRIEHQEFKSMCRYWRHYRGYSQLNLALAADVSQRHLSWLETGRSQPSREMVIKISDALDMPLRERNVLLQTAGFAAIYKESTLDTPAMAPVLEALTQVLTHHNPLPAFVIDRFWNIQMKNDAADLLLSVTGDPEQLWQDIGDNGSHNIALLTLHPNGLRKVISNWADSAPAFIRRLKREAQASGDRDVQDQFAALIALADDAKDIDHDSITDEVAFSDAGLLPVLPIDISIGDLSLSLFSVISTFGTPQDVTTDELRIEAFYPANEQTEAFFRR